jgi:hypothetical protein
MDESIVRAAQDDSGAAEGVGQLVGGKAGAATEVPAATAAVGSGGGVAGARTRCG